MAHSDNSFEKARREIAGLLPRSVRFGPEFKPQRIESFYESIFGGSIFQNAAAFFCVTAL
jgi:hypothetical protein